MSEWKKSAYMLDLKAGERVLICNCGESKKPPYCDGSHAGTGCGPEIVVPDEDRTVFVCGCRKSAKLPFCDGSHSRK